MTCPGCKTPSTCAFNGCNSPATPAASDLPIGRLVWDDEYKTHVFTPAKRVMDLAPHAEYLVYAARVTR